MVRRGEHCDAMMPLLFAVGQHGALEAIHRRVNPGEFLMAFHDDVYMATPPTRVGRCTQWCKKNSMCTLPSGFTAARPRRGTKPVLSVATHWTRSPASPTMIPTAQQGVKVLGTPIGHPDFVAAQLEAVRREHKVLLDRIPSVSDVQCAWLFLVHCASARACYYLRTFNPSMVGGLWQCSRNILQLDLHQCSDVVQDASTLPLALGGLGLHWASWADCLPMIHARHPDVAAELLGQLEGHPPQCDRLML